MSSPVESDKELQEAFREDVRGQVQSLVNDIFDTLENLKVTQSPDYPNYLKAVFDNFALAMGAVDGLCALRGVPQELRQKAMRTSYLVGKDTVLQQHKAVCADCSGGRFLEEELDTLN